MADRTALGALKARRKPGSFKASDSHIANDAYMQRFEEGFAALNGSKPQPRLPEPSSRDIPAVRPAWSAQPQDPTSWAGSPISQQPAAAADASMLESRAEQSSRIQSGSGGGNADSGTRGQLSERPLLCASVDWGLREAAVGGSDHAVYIVDVQTCKLKRTLFKSGGHSEWVSCVTHTPSGHVVSGGMDSRLLFWRKGTVRAEEMLGHTGPISQVRMVPGTAVCLSASYDKAVRAWDVSGVRPQALGTLGSHAAPVLEVSCSSADCIASGDRGGSLAAWQLGAGRQHAWARASAHQGHITALASLEPGVQGTGVSLVSGGQDGCLRAWDCRCSEAVATAQAHVDQRGKGAVGSIVQLSEDLLVSAGADCTLQAFSLRQGLAQAWRVQLPDFPYSLAAGSSSLGESPGVAICGCGDGSLIAVDADRGSVAWSLSGNAAAVRAVIAGQGSMFAAGDDGQVASWAWQ